MNYGKELSHAYIITGEPESAYAEARKLAQAIICSAPERRPCGVCRNCVKAQRGMHPDIITVTRLLDDKGSPRREIYVDQVREIVESASVLPNEADKKVYIVRDAGTMNTNAQNAFLKLLEEPPRFVSFILAADNAAQLLETVRSRCAVINLKTDAGEPSAAARALSEKYIAAAAATDPVALLSFLNNNNSLSGSEAGEFLQSNIDMLTDMLAGRLSAMRLERSELMRLIRLMGQAQEYLRFNVSVKHVFGLLSVDTIDLK